ncbi:armadillo-type protein [Cyathus striatus]|nr:armadillo-type protein [Cyathus striatus]
MCTAADALGPPLWGLRVHYGIGKGRRMSNDEERVVREEVGYALDELFRIDILDTLLPHLNTPNTQLLTHILNLFASCTRSTTQRAVLTTWTPPSERAKETMIEQGFVPHLMQIFHRASDSPIRRSLEVMGYVGSGVVSSYAFPISSSSVYLWQDRLLTDSDTAIQEQAFNILHYLASDDDSVDLVFEEVGTDVVLDRITAVLGGSDDYVILQATSLLANLANGAQQHKHSKLTHPRLLSALRSNIAESKPEARKRAVACVVELAEKSNRKDKRRMVDTGLSGRHLCEWSVAGVAAPSSPTATSPLRSSVVARRNSSVARSVSGGRLGWLGVLAVGVCGGCCGGGVSVEDWKSFWARTWGAWTSFGGHDQKKNKNFASE